MGTCSMEYGILDRLPKWFYDEDAELPEEEEYCIPVELPEWWFEEGEEIAEGYTDGWRTYVCSTSPAYFVIVPEYDYEGYFGDVKLLLDRIDWNCSSNFAKALYLEHKWHIQFESAIDAVWYMQMEDETPDRIVVLTDDYIEFAD